MRFVVKPLMAVRRGERTLEGFTVEVKEKGHSWSFQVTQNPYKLLWVSGLSPCCTDQYSYSVTTDLSCYTCGGPWAPGLKISTDADHTEWLVIAADWALGTNVLESHVKMSALYEAVQDWFEKELSLEINNARPYRRVRLAQAGAARIQDRANGLTS